MKKLLSMALTLAILLTTVVVGVVSASAEAYDTAIQTNSGTMVGDIGETFTYTVKIKSDKAITAGQIEIPVDFSYLSGESAAVINAKIDDVAPAIADTAIVTRFDTPGKTGLTGYVVNFATGGAYDFTTETPVITLSFTILKAGTISLKPTFREFLDEADNEIVGLDGTINDENFTSSTAVTLPKNSTFAIKTPRVTSISSVSNGLKVEWGAVEGGVHYGVFRHDASWVRIAIVDGTSYVDTNVESGNTYTYSVRVLNDKNGNLSNYVTCGWSATYIAEPKISRFESDATGLKLTVSDVNGASRFRIYRKYGTSWVAIGDVDGNVFKDTNVEVGTQYSYTVSALDRKSRVISSRNETGFSAYHLGAPVLKAPTLAAGYVTISWEKMTGAAKYRVFRKDPDTAWYDIGDTTGTSYNDKAVDSGMTYRYSVRCISADGSYYTSPYDVEGKSIQYVAAPSITKRANVNGGVQLTWSKSAGAAKYRVLRKTGSSAWAKVADTTGTTYTDKTVKTGTAYTYTIRCMNSSNAFNSSYNSTGWKITYIAVPPLKAVQNVYGGVKFTWTKPKGAVKFRVLRKVGKGSWTNIGTTAGVTFTDKKVSSGTTYIYSVCAVSSNGKTVQSSYNSTGKSIKYIAAPTMKSAAKSGKAVKVVWTKPKGAVKFRILRKVGNGKWAKLADTTATSFLDKKVKTKTKYSYTVCCITSNGKTVVSGYHPTGKVITYK